MSNLVSDVTGHSHDGHSTCLADGHHGHAFGPMASSFTAFFPDAVAPHHSDHFLPSISGETVHQGDSAHLDQFDQSLLATRRPKNYVSFHEHKEEKEGEWVVAIPLGAKQSTTSQMVEWLFCRRNHRQFGCINTVDDVWCTNCSQPGQFRYGTLRWC